MQAVLLLIAYAKKPADLDLHCLIKDKSRFSRTMVIAYISNLNFVSSKSPYIFLKKFLFSPYSGYVEERTSSYTPLFKLNNIMQYAC